jgi:hypothetical protein
MTKKQLLEKLNSSEELVKIAYVPVSEVINWVNELDEADTEVFSNLVKEIASEIADQGLDLIEDYDLEMNYREVELSTVTLDEDRIERAIKTAIDNSRD